VTAPLRDAPLRLDRARGKGLTFWTNCVLFFPVNARYSHCYVVTKHSRVDTAINPLFLYSIGAFTPFAKVGLGRFHTKLHTRAASPSYVHAGD